MLGDGRGDNKDKDKNKNKDQGPGTGEAILNERCLVGCEVVEGWKEGDCTGSPEAQAPRLWMVDRSLDVEST